MFLNHMDFKKEWHFFVWDAAMLSVDVEVCFPLVLRTSIFFLAHANKIIAQSAFAR